MTMDSATTCGHEVTNLSSEGEPTMEMTMSFGTYGLEVIHLASESEGGTNIPKQSLLVVGREQNLEDTATARDVKKKTERTRERKCKHPGDFCSN
jgi:hypothetical protein